MAAPDLSPDPRNGSKTPWWLWPNLLSLDAPAVAVAWLYLLALGTRNIFVDWSSIITLGCVVWVIYVIDRIVDARALARYSERVHWDRRHRFHYKYRGWFLLMVIPVLMVIAYNLLYLVPKQVFVAGLLPLSLCALYVVVAKSRLRQDPSQERVPFVKNILAGFAFAFGCVVSAAAYRSTLEVTQLFASPAVLCFALLCVLNITAVDLWAESEEDGDEEKDDENEISLTAPLLLLSLFTFYKSAVSEGMAQNLFIALFISSACLYLLNMHRHRFSEDKRRVLVDVAMLVPVPIFFLL